MQVPSCSCNCSSKRFLSVPCHLSRKELKRAKEGARTGEEQEQWIGERTKKTEETEKKDSSEDIEELWSTFMSPCGLRRVSPWTRRIISTNVVCLWCPALCVRALRSCFFDFFSGGFGFFVQIICTMSFLCTKSFLMKKTIVESKQKTGRAGSIIPTPSSHGPTRHHIGGSQTFMIQEQKFIMR